MLAGLEPLDDGRILIGGDDVSNVRPRERDIAMVFQSYALYPNLDVAQNMGFALKQQGVSKEERARRVRDVAKILDLEPFSTASRATFPAASDSASRWAARSCASRACTSWTSRFPTSTRSCACRPVPSSSSCRSASP
jgi:ABC-type glutathione transport system ATPase component